MSTSNGTKVDRRAFLKTSAALGCAATPYFITPKSSAQPPRAKNDRWRIGAIGMRYQGTVVAKEAAAFGDVVAICDVDRQAAEKAKADFGGKAELYEDYRKMLDRKDLDLITIGTPDHWHTKMVIDACRAGKHIYVEKPLTLTIDEGKRMCRAVRESGCIVQVGSWQRSDERFRQAIEIVRQGRIGKLEKVEVVLGKNVTGGPFKSQKPPAHFNWNLWQGQTPAVPYIPERSHYTFRWWYEYSGGQMTDWGAHHIDIAQWGINSLPVEVDGRAKMPTVADGYNVAVDFSATYKYKNGVTMTVSDTGRNGVMFTGSEGRIFVNRGAISGKPVEDLKSNPLPRDKFTAYAHDDPERPVRFGKIDSIKNHMANLRYCIESGKPPISDVESQHRSVSTCHIGNISMHLGRSLKWDPKAEQFLGDDEANAMLVRSPRKGFEIV